MIRLKHLGLALAISACLGVAVGSAARDQADAIRSALQARDFDRAIDLSRSALQASPHDAQLWTLQGIALARKGDARSALSAFNQALKLSPDYVAALEGAAQLHYEAGSREAVPLLNRLLRLRPGDPTSHAMLAVLEYPRRELPGGGRPLREGRRAARLGARRAARVRHLPRQNETVRRGDQGLSTHGGSAPGRCA